ncbi:MAG: hypothetical protein ACREVT_04725, partial [Burkholderiales bacterium]
MGTPKFGQFFLVPLYTPQGGIEKNLGGKNWFGHRVFQQPVRAALPCSHMSQMKVPIALTSILAALLLAACASISDKPQRFELRGFSFTAPVAVKDEKQWGVAKRTPDLLILGKPGEYQSEVFTVQAAVIRLPALASTDALLLHVKAAQQRELDPKRFRILKHEISLQPVDGESCALSHVEAADRAIPSTTGPTANMMLETLTLT